MGGALFAVVSPSRVTKTAMSPVLSATSQVGPSLVFHLAPQMASCMCGAVLRSTCQVAESRSGILELQSTCSLARSTLRVCTHDTLMGVMFVFRPMVNN